MSMDMKSVVLTSLEVEQFDKELESVKIDHELGSSRNFARIVCTHSTSKGRRMRKPSSMLKLSSSAGTESTTGKGPVSAGKNVRNSRKSRLLLYTALAVKDEPPGKVSVRNKRSSRVTISGGREGEPLIW